MGGGNVSKIYKVKKKNKKQLSPSIGHLRVDTALFSAFRTFAFDYFTFTKNYTSTDFPLYEMA